MSDGRPDLEARIQKLEEHIGFAERTAEELSGEIAMLNDRVRMMMKRLDALEKRLESLGGADDSEAEESA